MARTANFQALRRAVVDASFSDLWKAAVLEWEVTSVTEHPDSAGECVCGQTNLLWMYTITNQSNGAELFPIGSQCVHHFERSDLNQQIDVLKKLILLRAAAQAGEQITMTTDYYSRATLEYLYESGAFTPDQYNWNDGVNDVDFLLKMFGVRDKGAIDRKKKWRTTKLIENKIVPFVLADERLH